jgi:hypothetical protein
MNLASLAGDVMPSLIVGILQTIYGSTAVGLTRPPLPWSGRVRLSAA